MRRRWGSVRALKETADPGANVDCNRMLSIRHKAIAGIAGMTISLCVAAQTPQAAIARQSSRAVGSRTVPLVSDVCPQVRAGDWISLDWNPIFDPEWPVTGLRYVRLRFSLLDDDGVHFQPQGARAIGGEVSRVRVVPMANGFYHAEFVISKGIAPGVYRLTQAAVRAKFERDYTGQPPQMTVSPVDSRYCITVVAPLQSQQGGD